MADSSVDQTSEPAAPSERSFDVFISHSAQDAPIARKVADHLTSEGLRVWYDEYQLKPGDKWQERIREAIEKSRVCLVLLSWNTVSSKPYVSHEWAAIQECSWRRRDLALCSVRLGKAPTPPFLKPWWSWELKTARGEDSEIEQALKRVVLLVVHGGSAHDTKSLETARSATVDRFSELQRALECPLEDDRGDE
jgi:hypothetical protein